MALQAIYNIENKQKNMNKSCVPFKQRNWFSNRTMQKRQRQAHSYYVGYFKIKQKAH